MTQPNSPERGTYVRNMFGRIARRYDLLNRVMTFGQDRSWRRHSIDLLSPPEAAKILDLGSGTGDMSIEIRKQFPESMVVAVDFTPEMMSYGRKRNGGETILWVVADVHNLPFSPESFHGVTSGFLMRNVPDVNPVLGEQNRVLKSGGQCICLDTTPPRRSLLSPILDFHLNSVIPRMGSLLAGDMEAYQYLPSTTEGFLPAEILAQRMVSAGFTKVRFTRLMLGTIAIHWGCKA
ncbi:MAG: ubiquinone/menaquinone biosynthesis methyltransferase [Anaerolineales bacterium]|nr:ubiquinone/menaquinone biosynthesis methyltransferase [Anaerolineales bacterium]